MVLNRTVEAESDLDYMIATNHNFSLNMRADDENDQHREKGSDMLVNATNDLLRAFLLTVPTLLLLLGISGNFLVLRILAKTAFRKNILTVIFQALAISDLSALAIGLMRHSIFGITRIDVRLISPNWCWYHTWLVYSLTSTANWIVVLLTLIRILFLKYPLKVHSCCSRNVLLQLLVVLVCLNFAYYYMVFLVYLSYIPGKYGGSKEAYCGQLSSEGDIHYYFLNFVYFCLPCLVLWTMNIFIYVLHKKTMKRHRDMLAQRFHSLRRNTFVALGILSNSRRRFTVSVAKSREGSSSSKKVIYQRHAKGTDVDVINPVPVWKPHEDSLSATSSAQPDYIETEPAVPQILDVQVVAEHDILKRFEAHRRACHMEQEECPTNRQIFGTNVDTGQIKPHTDSGKKSNLKVGYNKPLDEADTTGASFESDVSDKRFQYKNGSKTLDETPSTTLKVNLPEELLSTPLKTPVDGSKSALSSASDLTKVQRTNDSHLSQSSGK